MNSPLTTHHSPLFDLPIFAFGLVSPWILAWLAAAALPILIHLLTRQRYRETPWAAMEYLLAAIHRHARRMKLEQWLLLAIRTLLIVLLVMAVAEPFLKDTTFASISVGRTHRVLVIDGSYSMAYKPGQTSRFDRAKELARQSVEESRQGDAFTLVLMSSPPRAVVGTPALEPAELLEEIDQLRLPHGTADLPATVATVLQVVRKARRENSRLTRHEVYFLTDLGRVGWTPELTGSAAAEFRKRSKELARAATLVVIDLGQPGSGNLAVTELRSGEPVVTPAKNVTIQAKVKNFGPRACGPQRVELLVDGRSAGEAYAGEEAGGLAPGEEDSVRFSHRFETPGDHAVEVRLLAEAPSDALDVDNHRFLALPVKQHLRVLCVNGRPSGGSYQDATDYLRVALSPEGQQAGQSFTRVEVEPEGALRELYLDRYDCVFLAGVAQFVFGEAEVLRSYLKHGGGLVFFLGEGVNSDNYNDELGTGKRGSVGLLPARLGTVESEGPFYFDPLEYRHSIVAAFRGREGAGLLRTPVNKYVKLTLPKGSKATVALAFEGGDPAIVEEQIERGRVVLVATSADASWTPMPLLPSYVPIVQELLDFAVGGQLQQRNFKVGQTLGAFVSTPAAFPSVGHEAAPPSHRWDTKLPHRMGRRALELRTPQGESEQIRLRAEGDYSSWSFSKTLTSGIYRARPSVPTADEQPVSRSEVFAVNVDTVESDLRKLTAEQLGEQIWSGIPFETSRENLDDEPVRPPIRWGSSVSHRWEGRRGTLSKWLLCAVLSLLFLETFLAWRFGHHAT